MIQTIKQLVEVESGLPDISLRTRKQVTVDARIIYAMLCLKHTKGISYERIAKGVNRDHSSVVHYKKLFDSWQQFPRLYSDKLESYKRVNDILERERDEIDDSTDLYLMYKKENIILRKENAALQATLKKLEERIKQLQKYAPIW